MAKQEEIRKRLEGLFYELGLGETVDYETFRHKILSYLQSQGVVIKGNKHVEGDNLYYVEPLI